MVVDGVSGGVSYQARNVRVGIVNIGVGEVLQAVQLQRQHVGRLSVGVLGVSVVVVVVVVGSTTRNSELFLLVLTSGKRTVETVISHGE